MSLKETNEEFIQPNTQYIVFTVYILYTVHTLFVFCKMYLHILDEKSSCSENYANVNDKCLWIVANMFSRCVDQMLGVLKPLKTSSVQGLNRYIH